MMRDPDYLETFEAMALTDGGDDAMEPEAAEITSSDDEPAATLEQARREWQAVAQNQPGGEPRRAGSSSVTNSQDQSSITRSSAVPPASEAVTVDSPEEMLEPPMVDTFKKWTKEMLTDASGRRIDLTDLDLTFKSTNGLFVNGKQAISELFGTKAFKAAVCCSPERPDLKISQEEALGWLLAYARGRKLLTEEARPIGKLAGTFATEAKVELDGIRDRVKKQRSRARQRGASAEELAAIDTNAATERAAITQAERVLKHMPAVNTVIVERRAPKPKPAAPAPRIDWSDRGNSSVAFWSNARHPEIKAYRGRPGGDDEERFWNPKLPPCVPSDDRPPHLFDTRVAAEAASAASQVEVWAPPAYEDEYYNDGERYDLACVKHQHALRRLREAFPEVDPCPLVLASLHETRPCPCGRGVLARWPWVAQTAQLGFCACTMASWELTCWRWEWLERVGRDLPC